MVPALLADAADHELCLTSIRDSSAGASGHAWFETYSVLTRLPADLRVSPLDAYRALDALLDSHPLSKADERSFRSWLGQSTVNGGAVYDALVAWAARSADLPLLTRDTRALPTYRIVGVEALLVA